MKRAVENQTTITMSGKEFMGLVNELHHLVAWIEDSHKVLPYVTKFLSLRTIWEEKR